MKMRILVILALLIGFASIGSASPKEDVQKVVDSFYAQYYKEYLLPPVKGDPDKAMIRWINANSYLSDAFKKVVQKKIVDARKADAELGLDSDPIVAGQDYPKKGYHAKEIQIAGDKANVVMAGIGEPDFKIPVDLVKIDNQWKINGIGDINRSRK